MSSAKSIEELTSQLQNCLYRIVVKLTSCLVTSNIPLIVEEAVDEKFSLTVDLGYRMMLIDTSNNQYDVKGIYNYDISVDNGSDVDLISTRLLADYLYFATR